MTSLKLFSGKAIQSLQKYRKFIQKSNLKLVIGRILGNGFEATWRCKINVLRVQMGHFSLI